MRATNAKNFREQLKTQVDAVIQDHEPLLVSRRRGGDFVVLSLADFQAEQETLRVLSDSHLMSQIRRSLETMEAGSGRVVAPGEL